MLQDSAFFFRLTQKVASPMQNSHSWLGGRLEPPELILILPCWLPSLVVTCFLALSHSQVAHKATALNGKAE